MNTTAPICLTLPPRLVERLDRAARADRRTRSNFVAVLLDRVLAEDTEPASRAEEAIADAGADLAGAKPS